MVHDDIAMLLGITRPTLVKHFDHELSIGARDKRAEVLEAMFRAAKKGQVAAARVYMEHQVEGAGALPPVPVRPLKGDRKGKKQEQAEAAVTAANGTEWDKVLPAPNSPGRVQ